MKKLQILGTGCPKCVKLAEKARAAAGALGGDWVVEKVTDVNEMVKMGVMVTPALAVNGKVRSAGRLLSVEEIKTLLEETPAG